MSTKVPVIPLVLLSVIFLSGLGQAADISSVTFEGFRLGKYYAEGKGIPEGIQKDFYSDDDGVTVSVILKDVHGRHEVKWVWTSPEGKVHSEKRKEIEPPPGKYYPRIAANHSIRISGQKAPRIWGKWNLDLYLDGEKKESIGFTLNINLPKLPNRTARPDPDKWALVIGIQEYLKLPPVEFAREDARFVKEYMNRVLGVPEQQITVLEGQNATVGSVKAELQTQLPRKMKDSSVLYVYFSGHGVPSLETAGKEPDSYFALYDSDATAIGITGYRVKEFLSDIGKMKFKAAYVVADACFSGWASRSDRAISDVRPGILVREVDPPNDKILAFWSSKGTEMSHSYSAVGHGLFTYYFLLGLNGLGDANGDGRLTALELYNFVKNGVASVATLQNRRQTPVVTPFQEDLLGRTLISVIDQK